MKSLPTITSRNYSSGTVSFHGRRLPCLAPDDHVVHTVPCGTSARGRTFSASFPASSPVSPATTNTYKPEEAQQQRQRQLTTPEGIAIGETVVRLCARAFVLTIKNHFRRSCMPPLFDNSCLPKTMNIFILNPD